MGDGMDYEGWREAENRDIGSKSELSAGLCAECAKLQERLEVMKQCFIDNLLKIKPEWKGTDLSGQIETAVDRVLAKRKGT